MTPSASIASFIKSFEGCSLHAYMPTPDDVPTIGYGSTGPDIKLGLTWTQAQALARFSTDLDAFGRQVAALIGDAPTTQGEYDAMCSLAYNIGIKAFAKSSVLTNHLAGHKATAALAFQLWDKQRNQNGALVPLSGLLRRRLAEADIYRGKAA